MRHRILFIAAVITITLAVLRSQSQIELHRPTRYSYEDSMVFIFRNIVPTTNFIPINYLDYTHPTNFEIESKWEPIIKGTNAAGNWIIRFK